MADTEAAAIATVIVTAKWKERRPWIQTSRM